MVKKLKAAGFTDEQAEALTETVRIAEGVDLSHLASKTDLLELENPSSNEALRSRSAKPR